MVNLGLRAELPLPRQPVPECPYRGLMPYTEDDSAFFFGRDQDTRVIVDNLGAYPLCVLFGPSGVGKSSVLRAGVMRRIRAEVERKKARFGVVDTTVAYFNSWKDDPSDTLPRVIDTALTRATGRTPDLANDRLDPDGVVAACEANQLDLLLIFDQFEEYFLYHGDDNVRFIGVLQRLLAPGSRVSVLIALREDALARLDDLVWALPGVFDHTLRLEHLDIEAAREAILQPVEHFNKLVPKRAQWSVDPDLVEALLDQVAAGRVRVSRQNDVSSDPEQVGRGHIEAPFLQLVLLRLWQEEVAAGSHRLSKATLERLGGAERIVREHLDRVVAAFAPEEHDLLAAVFGHLVTPSGTKIAHHASDLADFSGFDEAQVRHVLHRLCEGDQRILREVHPPGDDLGAESRFEVFHDVLALAILDWRRRWLADRAQEDANRALVEEKERAEATAQETHRRLQRARILLGALGLLLVACLVLGIMALQQADKAHRSQSQALANQRAAEANRDVASARALLRVDPAKALQTSLDAWTLADGAPSGSTADVLRQSIVAADSLVSLRLGTKPIKAALFRHGGAQIVTASDDDAVRVVDASSGNPERVIQLGAQLNHARLWSASLVADEHSLVVGTWEGRAAIVPLDGGEPRILRDSEVTGYTTVLAPRSGRRDVVITLGTEGYRAVAWDALSGRRIGYLGEPGQKVKSAAVSADGRYAVTWSDTGPRNLKVWDIRKGSELASAPLQSDAAPNLFFASGDRDVALITETGDGQQVRRWRWRTQGRAHAWSSTTSLTTVAWAGQDASGKHLVIATDKASIVWKLSDKYETTSSAVNTAVTKAAVSPNGHLLASATTDGGVVLDYADRSNIRPLWTFRGHGARVLDVSFSPSGDRLVSSAMDGSLRVWKVPQRVVDWGDGEDGWVMDARFTASGKNFVAATDRGVVQFVDAATGHVVAHKATDESPNSVDPDPSGAAVVIASDATRAPVIVRRDRGRRVRLLGEKLAGYVVTARWSPSPDVPVIVGGTGYSNQLAAWDAHKGGEPVWTKDFGTHTDQIMDLAFSDKADTLVAVSTDENLRVLNPRTGEVLRTLKVGLATHVAISADGRFAATGGTDQVVRIWDLQSSRKTPLLHKTEGLAGEIQQVAFSRDAGSTRLAAVTDSGDTFVWARTSGRLVAELARHSDIVTAVDFDPDNPTRLVTASKDGTAAVYSCTPCDLTDRELPAAAKRLLPAGIG